MTNVKILNLIRHSYFEIRNFRHRGFTLLEVIISIGIFSVVIVSAIGITLSLKVAQEKTSNIQDVQDNIRFALEYMTKELRQAELYQPQDCNPLTGFCQKIQFALTLSDTSQETVWYCLSGTTIYRYAVFSPSPAYDLCDSMNGIALTGDNIQVTTLAFYVVGNVQGPSDGQPRVTVAISANTTDVRTQLRSTFHLQTTVTQLRRDGSFLPSPVALWKFDEASGVSAADSSGNGHTGTLVNGPTFVGGESGNALSFNGANSYVDVADNDSLDPTAITMTAWVRLPSPFPTSGDIVAKGGDTGYRFWIKNNMKVKWFDRGATNSVTSIGLIPTNIWTHIAVVGDSAGLKIYINGILDASTAVPYGAPNTASSLKIGAEPLSSEYFNGLIDEVRIYNQALPQSQIQQIMTLP